MGVKPSIYSHPLGYHGHGAGSAIGNWDNQNGSPGGNYKVRANTAWSIELAAFAPVPEWGGQEVQFRAEENAFFDGKTVRYIDGRETTADRHSAVARNHPGTECCNRYINAAIVRHKNIVSNNTLRIVCFDTD